MVIFNQMERQGNCIELTTDKGEKWLIPNDSVIFVDDESGFVSLKGVATRKTFGLIPDDVYNGGGGDDPEYSEQYLTIESLDDDNAIGWKLSDNTAVAKNISYSTDGGETWATTRATAEGTVITTLNAGDKLLLKGNETAYSTSSKGAHFTSTGQFNVYGNIMSLLYSDDFENADTLTAQYTFLGLFNNCANLVSAENLVLPATTLTYECYARMFSGCTSLTTAPVLPSTTLAGRCYGGMFEWCSSLTAAPELPVTVLVEECYVNMFYGCTNLNYIKMLATDISASNCIYAWVSGVASTGTFVKNAAMTSLPTGRNGIPTGWTVTDATS